MRKHTLTTSTLLAAALAVASSAGAQTTFSDSAADFDTDISGVGDIQFDFDFSDFNHILFDGQIPAAPRTTDGSTTGIFLTANQLPDDPQESVAAIFPKNVNVGAGTDTPNFVLRFDAWHNTGTELPLGGTTNYQLAGVNFEAGPVQVGDFNSDTSAAQGAAMGVTADNGAAEDYLNFYGGTLYGDRTRTNTENQVWGDGGDNTTNQSGLVQMDILLANGLTGDNFSGSAGHPYYAEQFPAGDELDDDGNPILRAGVPANRWATHEISVVDDIFSYVIDGRVFAQIDLTTRPEAATSGTAMLGFWDRFGGSVAVSPPGANFVIYDNIEFDILSEVPVVDISAFIDEPELVGDLNADGFVGAGDLDILLGVWNQTVEGDVADLNEDGFIGAGDLDILLGNWNAGTPPTSVAAVPEPASLALVALGGLAMLRRRR